MTEFEKSFRLGLADLPRASPACPRCASALVLRVAKRGLNRGSQFWGCAAYPACTYTADLGAVEEPTGWRSYA